MTELTITPKVADKTAKFKGTIAAGEHVAVTIKGGAEWIGEDDGANLTLRVIDLTTKRTLAVFPRPAETFEDGETADAWDSSGGDLTCTLNLNTLRMVNAARHMLRVPVMFVLGDTDAPRALYFCDRYTVEYWPERIGDDVPYDLDAWPKKIDDWTVLVAEWGEQMTAFGTALSGHTGNGDIHVTAEQKSSWTAKQNAINDLETIRAGAAKGTTAIQSHQDISGKADLVGGKVPSSQLPSYVDDVLEYASAANFPATGEEGKIYVAKDENKTYRWSGTQYVQVGGSDITVDSALSTTSTNPVQNKVVKEALDGKATSVQGLKADAALSRAEAEAGFTEWAYSGLPTGAVITKPLTYTDIPAYGGGSGWDMAFTYDGASWTVFDRPEGDSGATSVTLNMTPDGMESITVTATRTRIPKMSDIPTKTSDLTNDGSDGEHPFISQHQPLAPVYSQTPTFSEWVCEPAEADGIPFELVGDGSEGEYWMLVWGASVSAQGYSDSTSLTWNASGDRPAVTATRVRTDLIGYTLGDQTMKPLQPQGAYAPSTNIPKSALASDVQTSLGKADTAVQPADVIDPTSATASGKAADALAVKTALAGKMDPYPFDSVTPTQTGWALPESAFPIFSNDDGTDYTVSSNSELTYSEGEPLVVRTADHPLLKYDLNGENGYADGVGPIYFAYGEAGETQTVPDLDLVYTATVSPYTVAAYTAGSTAMAFEIAVGALPTGVTGKARDCILVIDCTASGAVAPTVTWPSNFHPRTDTATDLAIVEAGKRAVFYISEYAPGEFAVGGWVETEGGSGT